MTNLIITWRAFVTKLSVIQYNDALAITCAIKGKSRTKMYKELVLESLSFRRWFRWICTFLKIKSSGKPQYLLNLIPTGQHSYNTRSLDQVDTHYYRTNAFKDYVFLHTIVEWNKLDLDIRKSKSYTIFWNTLLKLRRPNQCSIYRIHNPIGLKLLTRLRVDLSHFNKMD